MHRIASLHVRFLCLALLQVGVCLAAPIADGPYVTRQDDGDWLARWVDGDDAEPRAKEARVAVGRTVMVPGVGDVPAFQVRLREPDAVAPDQVTLDSQTPLFIVADTHGQFEILVQLLERHGIIDRSLRWRYGSGRLVVLGDVVDRGPNHTEILWLIYELENQARRAGGGVHFVLGNHETMVLRGDERYLHDKYRRVARTLGARSYADLFVSETVLGAWLRTKASVIRIGEYLCLHGGISPAIVDRGLSLAEINSGIRAVLNRSLPESGPEQERAQFLMGGLGPLWYRGYFPEQQRFPAASPEDIGRIRDHFDVRTILVGHTIVPTIAKLYGGKVVAVQVSMRRDEAGRAVAEGLVIEHGEMYRARMDGNREPLEPNR